MRQEAVGAEEIEVALYEISVAELLTQEDLTLRLNVELSEHACLELHFAVQLLGESSLSLPSSTGLRKYKKSRLSQYKVTGGSPVARQESGAESEEDDTVAPAMASWRS